MNNYKDIGITFASPADVDALVALYLKCFTKESSLAYSLGESFMRAAFEWFVTDAQAYVLVARHGKGIVGFTALAEKPFNLPMLRAGKWEAIKSLIWKPWLALQPRLLLHVFRKALLLRRNHTTDKIAHIAFTAVEPQLQISGIGKALKKETIRVCCERGMTRIVTGVRRNNLGGRALNESFGFVEVPELSTSDLIYLELDLDHCDQTC
jgi:ribosomal protein S18 acetylase RimI-like enzyme